VRTLLAAGHSVRQINPFKLRQFARASGVLAKNDRLDARMIALFTSVMPTQPAQQRHPATERLAVRRLIFSLASCCNLRFSQLYPVFETGSVV
jgi:transposase